VVFTRQWKRIIDQELGYSLALEGLASLSMMNPPEK
jgi:hypothetical protein